MLSVALPALPDFIVQRCVARGGMAEVYVAQVLEGWLRDTDVILKRLHPVHAHRKDFVDLFVAEAELGQHLVHPHIAQTYELIHRADEYFIVQEYVEGATLAALIEGGASLTALLTAFADLLEALAFLHDASKHGMPIIHRDVNPGNLVVRLDGVGKLIDFGIAEKEGESEVVRTGALAGTPAYMSPEQAKGKVLDRTTDVFSAGIVLWEVLSRKPLFREKTEFETLRRICEEPIPPLPFELKGAFGPLLEVALSKEPLDRYDSAVLFLVSFEEACQAAGIKLDRETLASAVIALAPPEDRGEV
jgi:serine/threonine-protein kinase